VGGERWRLGAAMAVPALLVPQAGAASVLAVWHLRRCVVETALGALRLW
jgi:hypothetical protein